MRPQGRTLKVEILAAGINLPAASFVYLTRLFASHSNGLRQSPFGRCGRSRYTPLPC